VYPKKRQIKVIRRVTTDSGTEYYIQSPDLHYYLNQIIYEFRGRDSIVQVATAVLDAAEKVTTELGRESRGEGLMTGNTRAYQVGRKNVASPGPVPARLIR
jgi:hypothetical protein